MADTPDELKRLYTEENRRAEERHRVAMDSAKKQIAKSTRSDVTTTALTAAIVIPLVFALWRWALGF